MLLILSSPSDISITALRHISEFISEFDYIYLMNVTVSCSEQNFYKFSILILINLFSTGVTSLT